MLYVVDNTNLNQYAFNKIVDIMLSQPMDLKVHIFINSIL